MHEELYEEEIIDIGIEIKNGQDCKLENSIYGLKQASRCWSKYLTDTLLQVGLKQRVHEPCLFYIRKENNFLSCAVHVDDTTVISSIYYSFWDKYINKLKKYVESKNLGVGKQLLGMELNYKKEKLIVSQKNY